MEELGLDYALLYPTIGLVTLNHPDAELRVAAARAFNSYYAEAYAGYRDRLEPVAVVPTMTPGEAVAELRHAVQVLGLKTAVMSGVVPREVRPDGSRRNWIDTLDHGSLHDYDPLWAACTELKVAPSFHGVGMGWGTRTSRSNYVFNHIGSFATAQEPICRSLIMGGAPARFPALRFSFLEGGVAWAAQLLGDTIGHWSKRNRDAIGQFDPLNIDLELASDLFGRHARGSLADYAGAFAASMKAFREQTPRMDPLDEFEAARFGCAADIVALFRDRFFFGCEADDPMNALAFNRACLPGGVPLNAMFASDIGHWDVPDMLDVLPEAWELVQDGRISEPEFADFTCNNIARLLTGANPAFFDGTAVAGRVSVLVSK
ncbi:MAG: amidohydrolase family protein [Gammaproteobacteria bacterium]